MYYSHCHNRRTASQLGRAYQAKRGAWAPLSPGWQRCCCCHCPRTPHREAYSLSSAGRAVPARIGHPGPGPHSRLRCSSSSLRRHWANHATRHRWRRFQQVGRPLLLVTLLTAAWPPGLPRQSTCGRDEAVQARAACYLPSIAPLGPAWQQRSLLLAPRPVAQPIAAVRAQHPSLHPPGVSMRRVASLHHKPPTPLHSAAILPARTPNCRCMLSIADRPRPFA